MYDWVTGDWHPVERDSRSNQCVLLVGETLSRLSNKYLAPTVHRVAVSTTRHNVHCCVSLLVISLKKDLPTETR